MHYCPPRIPSEGPNCEIITILTSRTCRSSYLLQVPVDGNALFSAVVMSRRFLESGEHPEASSPEIEAEAKDLRQVCTPPSDALSVTLMHVIAPLLSLGAVAFYSHHLLVLVARCEAGICGQVLFHLLEFCRAGTIIVRASSTLSVRSGSTHRLVRLASIQ